MKSAIVILEQHLDTMEVNEPINRQEGHEDQANLEGRTAAELRQALGILRAHVAYHDPVWPAPKLATD